MTPTNGISKLPVGADAMDEVILGKAGEVLPELVNRVRVLRE